MSVCVGGGGGQCCSLFARETGVLTLPLRLWAIVRWWNLCFGVFWSESFSWVHFSLQFLQISMLHVQIFNNSWTGAALYLFCLTETHQFEQKWKSYSIRKRSVNMPSAPVWRAHEQRFPCSLCRVVLGFVLSFYFLLEPVFHNPSRLHIHRAKLFPL